MIRNSLVSQARPIVAAPPTPRVLAPAPTKREVTDSFEAPPAVSAPAQTDPTSIIQSTIDTIQRLLKSVGLGADPVTSTVGDGVYRPGDGSYEAPGIQRGNLSPASNTVKHA